MSGTTMNGTGPAVCANRQFREDMTRDIPLPHMEKGASGMRWRLRPADPDKLAGLTSCEGLDPVLARVLAARNIIPENIRDHLAPSLRRSLPDPFVLRDMERLTERLCRAVTSGEEVGLFGDYDVDGVTSAAVFRLYFDAIGIPLHVYLPDRITENYGPSLHAFRDLHRRGAGTVVTVDCGSSAHETIEKAAAENMDILVIDHHLMSGPPPAGAMAVVNPARNDDTSGLDNLSAAGLSFLAVVALNRALRETGFFTGSRREPDMLSLLDLVALGLVCDVVPLTGLSRVLVAQGLKVFSANGNRGLKALAAKAGFSGPPSTYQFGFILGPRINAAGRVGHAELAFELLTTPDADRRRKLAEQLDSMNAVRREIEASVLADAERDIQEHRRRDDSVIVTAGEGWHPGVTGIVAGRLKEIHARPVIVIGLDGETGKGSGRSVPGVDLGSTVSQAYRSGLLLSGGGHAMAAGLTVSRDRIDAFRHHVTGFLKEDVALSIRNRVLEIDGVLSIRAVNGKFTDMIAKGGPYGPGNSEPVFAVCNVRTKAIRPAGTDHLSVTLADESGQEARGIAFRAAGTPCGDILGAGGRFHVAGKICPDTWRGPGHAQIRIEDVACPVTS